jgi:hypothetical protein
LEVFASKVCFQCGGCNVGILLTRFCLAVQHPDKRIGAGWIGPEIRAGELSVLFCFPAADIVTPATRLLYS